MNVDILDIKDHFFTDICFPFSENNSDMILKDRRSNIYQNYSLCDNNCEYDRINISSMIISCNCEIKKDIDTKKPPLKFEKIYVDLFSESTFGVSKCFNLVFDFKNKSKNIGFIIFTILVSLHIPILIYYFIVGIKPITKLITSAVANAVNNFGMDEESLYIAQIWANDGLRMKRYLPRAKGSASGLVKRNSHLYVVVKMR